MPDETVPPQQPSESLQEFVEAAQAIDALDQLYDQFEQGNDPWQIVNVLREQELEPEDRLRFLPLFFHQVAPRSTLERDVLLHHGRQVFNYTMENAREEIERIRAGGEGGEQIRAAMSVQGADFLAEAILTDDASQRVKFLVWRDSQPPEIFKEISDGIVRYIPPQSQWIERGLILLPTAVADPEPGEQLFNDLRAFVDRYLQLPADWRDMLILKALESWVLERFNALGYIRFSGDADSGKSRALDVLKGIMRRGLQISGVTAAMLYRMVDKYQVSLIVDEADLNQRDELHQLIQTVFNIGYKRGAAIPRMDKGDSGRGQEMLFDPFGAKALATRREFEKALETRCVTFTMRPTDNAELRADIPRQLPPEFYVEAQALQNRLLRWRLENFRQIDVEHWRVIPDLTTRANEIALSTLTIARAVAGPDSQLEKDLLALYREGSRAQREERNESWEGIVAAALAKTWAGRKTPDRLLFKLVVERIALDHPELREQREDGTGKVSSQRVGSVIRKVLGLKTVTQGGERWIVATDTQVAQAVAPYGCSALLPSGRTKVAQVEP